MRVFKFIVSMIMVSFLFGCTVGNQNPTVTPTSTSVPITPQSGKASVIGQMVHKEDATPVSESLIRLAKIYGEGTDSIYIFNDTDDPGTYTDKEGSFVFSDVEPGQYAVLIMNQNGDYLSINETTEKILTVNAVADTVTDMGQVQVDLSTTPK